MSLPEPHPGLVIRFPYLWHHESEAGLQEGVKDRPCAILMNLPQGDKREVLVVPITHLEPPDKLAAVEIPEKTRVRLGLDKAPCWAICSEVNQFYWPGPDIRRVPGTNNFSHGVLPSKLFAQIKAKAQFLANGRQLKLISRG
jgi:uncharacterized protein YifN (PemK superfamily)